MIMSKQKSIVCGAEISSEMARNLDDYQSLGKYLTDACIEHADTIFMVDAETKDYVTYKDVLEKSYKIAKLLKTRGGSSGTVVAIVYENSFEYPSLLLAGLHIGAVCTCINPLYSTNELQHAFNISKTSIVLTSAKLVEKIKSVLANCNSVREVINIDEIIDSGAECTGDFQSEVDETNPTNSSAAMILYSSGTTGTSKAVLQSHKSWIFLIEIFRTEKVVPFPRNNVVSGFLPMSHTYGLFSLLVSLVLGHKYVLIKRYQENTFLHYIEIYRMSTLYIVPAVVNSLVKNDETVTKYDTSSVKLIASGGGVLRADIQEAIRRRFNCDFFSHCGMTETIGMTLYAISSSKPGVTGRLVPGMMAKIVDLETGDALEKHEKGEYLLKGPLMFNGYLGIAATEGTFDSEGWYHTGDVAYYDDDEDFYIVDRMKELIKYKGYQVPPAELEILILKHPEVVAAGVVGVPDELVGELPRAYVVKKEGSDVTEDDILQYVANNISPMKKLRGGVRFVDDLPRTSIGKVNRKELKNLVTNSL